MTATILDVDHQAIAQSIVDCAEIDPDDYYNTVNVIEARLPRGIAHIGSGCYRAVYRHNGWVYKVDFSSDCETNLDEYDNYLRALDCVPDGFALPETHLVSVGQYKVIVMEYIEGSWATRHNFDIERRTEFTEATGISDLHGGNLRIRDGVCYVIDLGYSER